MKNLKIVANNLLGLFFPNNCLFCERPLVGSEEHLCLHCLCSLPRTYFHRRSPNPMEQRFYGKANIFYVESFLFFEKKGITQKGIHLFKYHENKELAYHLGKIAAQELQDDGHPICHVDGLVPVPLHPKKQRKRGYNQAEWIAKGIQSVWNCPIYPHILIKRHHTESQTLKSGLERWDNTRKLFAAYPDERLRGKHLLVVDDVITTGATIGACAEALSTLPETRISLFSLAVAMN